MVVVLPLMGDHRGKVFAWQFFDELAARFFPHSRRIGPAIAWSHLFAISD